MALLLEAKKGSPPHLFRTKTCKDDHIHRQVQLVLQHLIERVEKIYSVEQKVEQQDAKRRKKRNSNLPEHQKSQKEMVGKTANGFSPYIESCIMAPPKPNPFKARLKTQAARVFLMHSEKYESLCNLVTAHKGRDKLLYSLLKATGIWRYLSIQKPAFATMSHLEKFHAKGFLEVLRSPEDFSEQDQREFGLEDDCEVFPGLWEYAAAVCGASLQAAGALLRGEADVAINWGGGRHHARRARAGGFCYANDAVLAALHMTAPWGPQGRRRRVLYVDIDVHHCDGVEEAFYYSDAVFCLSFHKHAPGFYPADGSGAADRTGGGPGIHHTLNVPLGDGCGDAAFLRLFSWVLKRVLRYYKPEMIILQCGCDTLSSDPLGPWNLTSRGVAACVALARRYGAPLLLLGGGGYAPRDTARCWAAATAAAIAPGLLAALPPSIPDHPDFHRYGPGFEFHTAAHLIQDSNVWLTSFGRIELVLGKKVEEYVNACKIS